MQSKLCFAFLAAMSVLAPALASESQVQKVFKQIEINAKKNKLSRDNASAVKGGKEEKALVYQLNGTTDLLQLIRLCSQKRRHLPGTEQQHEAEHDYFMDCEQFAIRKIGAIGTPQAAKALDQVEKLESGNATVMEVITEAREKCRH